MKFLSNVAKETPERGRATAPSFNSVLMNNKMANEFIFKHILLNGMYDTDFKISIESLETSDGKHQGSFDIWITTSYGRRICLTLSETEINNFMGFFKKLFAAKNLTKQLLKPGHKPKAKKSIFKNKPLLIEEEAQPCLM